MIPDEPVDPWLNPFQVHSRSMVFEHGSDDVHAALELVGPVDADNPSTLVNEVVARVHQRLLILPSAFGHGMPNTLAEIVARRGGNCVSHAVLATVVLRQLGIPTRLITENVYTGFSFLRLPAAAIRAPIGPTLNSHVWCEVLVAGEWIPADAELGVCGTVEWLAARVAGPLVIRAVGPPITERWLFPLRLRRLAPDGMPADDISILYLVDRLRSALDDGVRLPDEWSDGVAYFASSFDWEGRPGIRILRERRVLRDMATARTRISARLVKAPGATWSATAAGREG